MTSSFQLVKADPTVPTQTDDGEDPINLIFYGDATAGHVETLLIYYWNWDAVGNCWFFNDKNVNGQVNHGQMHYPFSDSTCYCSALKCRTHLRTWNMGNDATWGTWSIAAVHKEHWSSTSLTHIVDSWEEAEGLVREQFEGLIPCEVESVDTYWLGNNQQYQGLTNNGYATRVKVRPLGSGPPCSWGSVAPGTLITLAEGTKAPVQNLRVGDRLSMYNIHTHSTQPAMLTEIRLVSMDNLMTIHTQKGPPLRIDANPALRLYTIADGETILKSVLSLQPDDLIYNYDLSDWVTITRIEVSYGGRHDFYDLRTDPYIGTEGSLLNFIANGYADPCEIVCKTGPTP